MPWVLECETSLSSSHQLRHYEGKCANLHGHNWKVRARVWVGALDSRGLSIDFGDIKTCIMRYDHKHLNDFAEFAGVGGENNPTAENLARAIWLNIVNMARKASVTVAKVQVDIWETEKNRVQFEDVLP